MYKKEFFEKRTTDKAWSEVSMFSERLRTLRRRKGETQESAADKLGIPKATYGTYENGKYLPDAEKIAKMADFYNVSADYLLGLTKDFQGTSVSNVKLSKGCADKIKDISENKAMLNTLENLIKTKKFKEFIEFMDKYLVFSSVLSRFELECLANKGDYAKIKNTKVYDNVYCEGDAVLRDIKVSAIYQSLLEECFRNILADMSRHRIYEDRLADLINRMRKEN